MVTDTNAMLAERAIRRCLLDYCRGVDTCDAELVASVYHPDSYDDHGTFQGTGREFADVVTAVLRSRYLATNHLIGGTVYDWIDDDTVRAETYIQAQHLGEDDDGKYLEWFTGVYVDRFERRDEEWRIAERLLRHTWDKTERIETCFPPGSFTPRERVERS